MENKQLIKELRMTRIFCIISSLLTVGLLVGGFLVWDRVQPVISVLQEAQPVMEQLSQSLKELDVDAINEAVAGLDTEELTKAIENLNKVASTLEKWGNTWNSLF